MLKLEGIDAFYGDVQALHGVSFEVNQGEIVALVGANAAGKTTSLRVISGILAPHAGRVAFQGADLGAVPAHRRVDLGIVQVPEGRRLFPDRGVATGLTLVDSRTTGSGVAIHVYRPTGRPEFGTADVS